jgi:hypothetical protein
MKLNFNIGRIRQVFASTLSLVVICAILVQCNTILSGDTGKQLEEGFLSPPDAAKPRVWWHWMNGNITKEGIRADLEWMHRVGVGGFQNFDAGMTTPQVVEKRLVYMTPGWKDAFRFATKLADSLDLEMAIAGSPGWSESGGPWVKPEQAMKKIVWSETRVEGGKQFSGIIPKPPVTSGPFQNLKLERGFGAESETTPNTEYYADAAVVAFRVPENDFLMTELQPKITSSGGKFSIAELTDGDLVKSVLLPSAPVGGNAWIQIEFAKPETVQALSIVAGGGRRMFGPGGDSGNRILEVSDDGKSFSKIIDITNGGVAQRTLAFAPVTGKYFRVSVKTPPPSNQPDMFAMFRPRSVPGPAGTQIAEVVLHTGAYVNRFEEKAAFSTASDLIGARTPEVLNAVSKADVMDLTLKMDPDGKLNWTVPEGKWVVLRLGYSLTGHRNSPASPEATGLEVDKLSADHVKSYFTDYLNQYKDATGGLMGKKGLQYIITDSWEAGTQNWTDNMIEEFNNRRGYDITPWMPVLTGHVVESAEASDRFLWDFRKTLIELVAVNHYDQLTKMLNERGMGRYTESHEGGRAFIGDGMEVKRTATVPMSATWTPGGFGGNEGGVATRHKADVRESASVSHIYGQNLVAAESMTAMGSDWAWSPELLKPVADMELASGLNRFVIHTSVHQPSNDKIPGMSLGPFGQWFTRHETWAEQAGAWTTYLARSSYMLQQGKFVADIIYYYGEDNNITALFGQKLPDVPAGYEYDFVNADALINVLSVNNGSIVTQSGMHYRVLALDPLSSQQMSLPVLRKIRDLVNEGAVVTGQKPLQTPSLSDDQTEFTKIVNELWANDKGENSVGQGKVYAGQTIQDVLNNLKVIPDFTYTKPQANTNLLYVHRKIDNVDIYWVNNRNDRVEDLEASFRVDGRQAEIWHPETGKIEKPSYLIENGITKVSLHLVSNDAVFVVFRNKAKGTSYTTPKVTETLLSTVEGPWKVSFQAKRGTPILATLDSLTLWNENADKAIKYFSGTGTYSKTVQAPAEWFREETELWLDLGSVQNLAEIVINGKSLGIVWKTPFMVNATEAIHQGENNLEIKVTNLWVNRLIGDQQPDVREKTTFVTNPFYRAESPLKPSGLLGPVQVLSLTKN